MTTRSILVILGGGLLGFFAVMAMLCLMGHGWLAQVRLDCGDLRYCYLGYPVILSPMAEPARATLLDLSEDSLVVHADWQTCEVFPRRGDIVIEQQCRDAYRRIAAWADVDRTIARLALEDIAEYIERTGATTGVPVCAPILGADVIDSTIGDVLPNWQSNPNVLEYCAAKGYTIPSSSPAATAPADSAPTSQPLAPGRP